MEYIFGYVQRNGVTVENLKTVGEVHSHLSGFIQTVREYPDATITDVCRITEHYRSEEDGEGNCYDWYLIADHWRNMDKFSPVQVQTEEANAVASIVFATLAEGGSIDDVTASEHASNFAEWQPSVSYKVGNIRRYGDGLLYRCIQDHTSQADWTPDTAVSPWTNISDPAEEWPAWSQPVGAYDAYQTGDKVTHSEKHWKSTVDDNVWEPGVYGWEEVNE